MKKGASHVQHSISILSFFYNTNEVELLDVCQFVEIKYHGLSPSNYLTRVYFYVSSFLCSKEENWSKK